MNTEELIQPGRFYLAGLGSVRKAFLTALGPEVEAWFRQSRETIERGYREENWFLTPTHIVRSVATPNEIEFEVVTRSSILAIHQRYEVISESETPYAVLRRVNLLLSEGRNLDIPVPDTDYLDEYGKAYREFVSKLVVVDAP